MLSASGFEVARTKLVIQIQAGANQKYMVRQNQLVARVPMAAHEVAHKQTEGGTQPTGRTHVALHIQGAARREQNAAHTQGAALAELMMARSNVVLTYRIGCLVPCRLMFHPLFSTHATLKAGAATQNSLLGPCCCLLSELDAVVQRRSHATEVALPVDSVFFRQ